MGETRRTNRTRDELNRWHVWRLTGHCREVGCKNGAAAGGLVHFATNACVLFGHDGI